MKSRFFFALLIALVMVAGAAAQQADPVIDVIDGVQHEARLMDILRLGAIARCPESLPLVYQWTLVDPTGYTLAYLGDVTGAKTAQGMNMTVSLPWLASEVDADHPNSANTAVVGSVVYVDLVIKHVDDVNHPESFTRRFEITITGVNHPPVPGITGVLGTDTNRIPSGSGVICNSATSTDPDSDTIVPSWTLGGKTGGSYVGGGIVPIGSSGSEMGFTVPDMTSNINQIIVLYLQNGLHVIQGTATAYLKPAAGGGGTGSTPAVTVSQTSLTKTVGDSFTLSGTVQDNDGDNCSVTWLHNGATVQGAVVTPVTVSAPAKKWSATYTTTASSIGTHIYRLTGTETATTDHRSAYRDVTVTVTSGTTLPPDPVTETPEGCTGNTPPTVTISPDPHAMALVYKGGQQVTIVVTGKDTTVKETSLGTTTGTDISWPSLSTELPGVTAPQKVTDSTDKTISRSTLSFTAPDQDRTTTLTVKVNDKLDCGKTIQFTIHFEKNDTTTNQPPTANIKYKVTSGGTWITATGAPVDVDSPTTGTKTLYLDANGSTDDGGVANLTAAWNKADSLTSGSVTLSSATSKTPNLSVAAGTAGSVTLTLQVTDQGQASDTETITFNIGNSASRPTANIKYKITSSGTWIAAGEAPVAVDSGSNKTVYLDANDSADDGGVSNLTALWSNDESLTKGSVQLSSVSSKTPSLVVSSGTMGSVVLTLQVTDQTQQSDTATVTFNITDPNYKPTADAVAKVGDNVLESAVEEGITVALDGSNSTNCEQQKTGLSYSWEQVSGQDVTIEDAQSQVASFVVPPVENDTVPLVFKLTVTDTANSLTATDQVTINLMGPGIYFAQVGVGLLNDGQDELRTVLLLVNNTNSDATDTTVEFFNGDGQPFAPMIGDHPWNKDESFTVRSQFSKRLVFTPADGQTAVGWARVKSAGRLDGLAQYQVVHLGAEPALDEVTAEVSVFPSSRGRRFATYFNAADNTGIAVANPTDTPVQVYLKLVKYVNDDPISFSQPLFTLGPQQHAAKFVEELIGEMTSTFPEGALIVEIPEGKDGQIITTVLKTKGALIFSSLPLAVAR